jgi:MFS family permease
VIRETWGISNSAAGLVSGMYFGGYMVAVPVLTSLTDRLDARRVYLLSASLSALGALGFALFGRGLPSALAWQAVGGMGLAGTYMPGLKILTDHIEGRGQSRAIAFYTSTFGIGTSVSFWLAGAIAAMWPWPWAFALSAIGPAVAGVLVVYALPPARAPLARSSAAGALDLRRLWSVLANPPARRFVAAYGAHCWELFGVRSWIVAFFAFAATVRTTGAWLAPATAAALINLLGPIASILGNEVAVRMGRVRHVTTVMTASIAFACVVGFASGLASPLLVVVAAIYFLTIMADSATLTAGVVAASDPAERGATMAVYSLAGFGAGFLAPLVFGAVMDGTGGETRRLAWGLAFASLAVPTMFVLPALIRTRRSS